MKFATASHTYLDLAAAVRSDLLAGRRLGEAHLPKILDAAAPGLVIVDLTAVKALTSSYFLAALWPLWQRNVGAEIYPVLANLAEAVADDIEFALRALSTAAWFGTWKKRVFAPLRRAGHLDDALAQVLERAMRVNEIGAWDFAEESDIAPTVWNNRLSALHAQRLLQRRKDGRRHFFSVPWNEVSRG